MKLYLSSYRIPSIAELEKLLGKSLQGATVALIPNAKDYYVERARDFKVGDLVKYMKRLGLKVEIVDLRTYDNAETLKSKLAQFDLIWAMGGNTYMLRYEMHRSGFDIAIKELLDAGSVYGGDSAGALVAGQSIAGVESADEPEFAEVLINDGLGLAPFVILPHVDNPEFADVLPAFRELHKDKNIIELTDAQAAIFEDDNYRIV
ncbi:MAG TPA: Type 1 glutamine amidotransferase-like domain-containing protein [Candidatus Saccharimonadales bacterium]|nr:Type 1 glutamine amidotransferase-like domain-containing protein [Candidatus Saccharimonadales bacterium]